eukprot:7858144-Ditylum_brightwellii.AAC.2
MAALTEGLDQWRKLEDETVAEEMDDNIAEAFAEQTRIGWNAAALGFLSSKWQKVQQLHLEWKKSRRSSSWFVAALIKKLWDVSWDLWQHRNEAIKQGRAEITIDMLALLHNRIRFHYRTSKTSVSAYTHYFFCLPLTTILSSPPCQQAAWLEGATTSTLRFHARL